MPRRKVTTTVQLVVELTVPYKKTPGHVLQWVTKNLQRCIEYPIPDIPTIGLQSNDSTVAPSNLKVTLTKKETTYA